MKGFSSLKKYSKALNHLVVKSVCHIMRWYFIFGFLSSELGTETMDKATTDCWQGESKFSDRSPTQ